MPTTLVLRQLNLCGRDFTEIRLDSTSGVNPLSASTVQAMRDVLAQQHRHGASHGLVIRSQGRCFCAGADVKEFAGFGVDGFRAYMTSILAMYAEMVECPVPIVSLVHADALGGGAALAFFSDFGIAVEGARFALPEVHRGLAGGGYLMPRLVGKQRAAEMVLLGRSFGARQTLEMGLLNEVCADGELDARAEALLTEIAALSPGALAVAKTSLSGGLALGLREAMALHVEAQTAAFVRQRASAVAPA